MGETEAYRWLDRKCKNCGYELGVHRAVSNNCPDGYTLPHEPGIHRFSENIFEWNGEYVDRGNKNG